MLKMDLRKDKSRENSDKVTSMGQTRSLKAWSRAVVEGL